MPIKIVATASNSSGWGSLGSCFAHEEGLHGDAVATVVFCYYSHSNPQEGGPPLVCNPYVFSPTRKTRGLSPVTFDGRGRCAAALIAVPSPRLFEIGTLPPLLFNGIGRAQRRRATRHIEGRTEHRNVLGSISGCGCSAVIKTSNESRSQLLA